MGGGSWTTKAFASYTSNTRGLSVDDFSTGTFTAQEVYHSRRLANELDPKNVMRECCDSEEHPNTLPVILALDVTGSMGDASVRVAQKLNEIMTALYADETIKDIEFCVMGIGDLAYDDAPIQISQFESDVRIAEQLDKIYFEAGGGGNTYESYTAAWYMGVNHCKLDCWNRGKKGIIITMGDELPNPHLPKYGLASATGDKLQADVETPELYQEALKKFNIYHISIDDRSSSYEWHKRYDIDGKWIELLGTNYRISNLDGLPSAIIKIIQECINGTTNQDEVSW